MIKETQCDRFDNFLNKIRSKGIKLEKRTTENVELLFKASMKIKKSREWVFHRNHFCKLFYYHT